MKQSTGRRLISLILGLSTITGCQTIKDWNGYRSALKDAAARVGGGSDWEISPGLLQEECSTLISLLDEYTHLSEPLAARSVPALTELTTRVQRAQGLSSSILTTAQQVKALAVTSASGLQQQLDNLRYATPYMVTYENRMQLITTVLSNRASAYHRVERLCAEARDRMLELHAANMETAETAPLLLFESLRYQVLEETLPSALAITGDGALFACASEYLKGDAGTDALGVLVTYARQPMRASSEYWTLIGLAARRIEQRLALSELTITDVEILRGLLHRAIAEAQGTSAASEVDKECCRFLSVCADNIALVQNKRYADASTHFLAYIEPLVPTKTVVVEARRLAILRAGMAEAEQMLKQGAERESVDFLRSFVASVNLGAGVQEQVADRIAQIERQHVRRLKERFDVTCSADRYGEACEGLIAMQREYPEAVETKVAHSTLAGRWPSFVTNLQHKEKHVEALREVETMLQYQAIGKDVGVALCVPHLSGNARLADGSADRYASVVRKLDPACGELVAYDDAAEAKRKEAEAKEKAVMEEELKRLLSLAREAQAVRDEYDRLKLKAYGDTSSTSTTEVQLYLQTKVLPVADQLEKLAESFAARFGLERLRDEANKHNFADILR